MYFEATDAPSGLGTRIMLPGAAPSGTCSSESITVREKTIKKEEPEY